MIYGESKGESSFSRVSYHVVSLLIYYRDEEFAYEHVQNTVTTVTQLQTVKAPIYIASLPAGSNVRFVTLIENILPNIEREIISILLYLENTLSL